MANENSVLFALNELQTIEAERMTQEAEDAQRVIAEAAALEAAKADALQEAELKREAVAEAEARMRLDAETEAQERAERIARLQAELDTVQHDRTRLHQLALAAGSAASVPEPRSSAWPMAFAAVSALAMALSAWIIVRTPEVQVREVMVPSPMVEAAAEPAAEAPTLAETPTEPPPVVEEAAPEVRVRPARPVRPRPRDNTPGLDRLDECDSDDPLCGI